MDAKRLKKEQDMQKLEIIEEGFQNEIEPRKTEGREHLSFSQSAILVCADPDNNSNGDTKDDISIGKDDFSNPMLNDIEIQEETALLIESIMHPADFEAEPEIFDNSDQHNLNLLQQQLDNYGMMADQGYNVFGQRYHPNASPYEYQFRQMK